jgi:ketosteroid isomerase-like protein
MATVTSVRPIPGPVPPGTASDPELALERFYWAFNHRDLAMMGEVWDHSDDVVAISPLADVARTWPALRAVYERIFGSEDRLETEFFDYSAHRSGDVFYAVGRERGRMLSAGETRTVTGRATNIFHRTPDGIWKLVHHHVSLAGLPDPG